MYKKYFVGFDPAVQPAVLHVPCFMTKIMTFETEYEKAERIRSERRKKLERLL